MRYLLCFPFLMLALVACEPTVMFAGGELSGEIEPVPSSWAFTNEVDTVQLETRPDDPYSVNVWAVAFDDAIFVTAGGGRESEWARHIAEDDRVRLRVGEAIYELSAVEKPDEETRRGFLRAAQLKYDFEPTEEQQNEAILYRLEPR